MIEIVEKIAVKSRIITIVPGKKYSWYDMPAEPSGGLNDFVNAAPKSTQKNE